MLAALFRSQRRLLFPVFVPYFGRFELFPALATSKARTSPMGRAVNALGIIAMLMIFTSPVFGAGLMARFIGFDENCDYTRKDAMSCISRYIDTNFDHSTSVAEVDAARDILASLSNWLNASLHGGLT